MSVAEEKQKKTKATKGEKHRAGEVLLSHGIREMRCQLTLDRKAQRILATSQGRLGSGSAMYPHEFQSDEAFALRLDAADPLRDCRTL
jgi:hypothetical protein